MADIVHNQLVTGSKLRILTQSDTFSRHSPTNDPHFSYRGEDVVQTVERMCGEIGYPKSIRIDNGCVFVFHDPDQWAYQTRSLHVLVGREAHRQ